MPSKPARDRVPAVPKTGEDRIAAAFALRRGRAALMPYLMGGFPDMATSRAIGEAYAANGADLVELGVPYSDPLADGPVIHEAGTAALRAGATIGGVLEVSEALSRRVPVMLMCYVNLVLARGPQAFAAAAREAGVSGLIVPDLPFQEAPEIEAACREHSLVLVPLVAPTTTDERLASIGAQARGFIYTVSVTGTTGERASGEDDFRPILDRVHASTSAPVALGFGLATADQAAAAARAGADGVIVGTRLVRAAAEAEDPAAATGELVAALAAGLIG
jgi:tryptophan synthase alpha chain